MNNSLQESSPLSRRQFLCLSGLALGGATLLGRLPVSLQSAEAAPTDFPQKPNIVLMITDQERFPQHWPDNWDFENNLPGRHRLAQHGLTFNRAFCNSAMCSPSRANLFTGLYPAQHGVERTLTYGEPLSYLEQPLPIHLQNMARMLASSGYHVVLKGKWHLSKNNDGLEPDSQNVAEYGFLEWEATSAGEAADPVDFGGGCANWDSITTAQAINFLQSPAAHDPNKPFALIVSVANPHDVLSYPRTWNEESEAGCFNYRDTANFDRGIPLPPTIDEDLSQKPAVQAASRDVYAAFLGMLSTTEQKQRYVNFYADLQILVDQHIVDFLDTLDAEGLTNDTLIIRLSDHGEMGLSHGGLRQKMFNAYEETIHVPLVISNPTLFPNPVQTSALASLVDIMPTLASIAHVPNVENYDFRGCDLSPILDDAIANPANPTASVQDTVVFTFDDDRAGTGYTIPGIQNLPFRLRCIRLDDQEGEWKFVRYFNPDGGVDPDYEMYHLTDNAGNPVDPHEEINLADENSPNFNPTKFNELALKLAQIETVRLSPYHHIYLPLIQK